MAKTSGADVSADSHVTSRADVNAASRADVNAASRADVNAASRADVNADARADVNADVAALSYEQARDELVGIVGRLEGGQVGLEESMSLWARGEVLAAHCSTWLDRAEQRLAAAD